MRAACSGHQRRCCPSPLVVILIGLLVACQGGTPPPRLGQGGAEPAAAGGTARQRDAPSAPRSGRVRVAAEEPRPTGSDARRRQATGRGDCLAVLADLRTAAKPGALTGAASPWPAAVLLHRRERRGIGFGDHHLRLDPDLPLAVHDGGGGGPEPAVPCLLVVVEPEDPPRTERREVTREQVASAYAREVIREDNPAYEAAKIRARQAEKRLSKGGGLGLITVGDPLLDLVGTVVGGLLGSLGAASAEREFQQALVALENTPRQHERPVWQPYRFDRLTVRASKRTAVPVALIDRERDRVWSARVPLTEEREFELSEGMHARDRDVAAHRSTGGESERDLELWERAAPEVRLSTLVERFLAAAPSAQPGMAAADPAATAVAAAAAMAPPAAGTDRAIPTAATSPTSPRPAPTDNHPCSPSVVRIAAEAGSGTGFYIAPELVLTDDHLVAGAIAVDVTVLDGTTVLGLVARRDPGRGLALIQVPKPGPPLALEERDAAPLGPGSAVEAIGRPRPGEPACRVAQGTVSATRRAAGPRAAGLRDVLVIRTDAALDPEDSGGPLLRGGRVVGVTSGGGGATEPNGTPNLAVHHQEVLDFLAEAGL